MARNPERRRVSRDLQNTKRRAERYVKSLREAAKRTHNAAERDALRRQAKNLTARIKRASTRGKTLEQSQQILGSLQSALNRSQHVDEFVKFEMKRAQDSQRTRLFGPGKIGRARVQAFFMYYKNDWRDAQTREERYQRILDRHPGHTLFELFQIALSSTKEIGNQQMTFEEYIAFFMGLDYADVDTSDPAWRDVMGSTFDNLDSPTKDAIVQAWSAYHA